jgi:NAD(P)-dependent dehydrogenase (short-subunit alcohol dehydrogenase family)
LDLMKWTAARLPRLDGRVAIVTGGNSGIGMRTAAALAAQGARVTLASRDPRAADQVAQRIRRGDAAATVSVRALDLASMAAVRAFADGWTGPLDLLVNNAGVMAPPRLARTAEGFELQFGTNHLGHYVLTGLLLPALLESGQGRVVTVASIVHHRGTQDVVDGNAGPGYDPQDAYAQSKLANLLFALELQRQASARGLALTSVAAHPGLAATGLFNDREGMGANPFLRFIGPRVLRLVAQSPTAGARSTLYAATEAAPGSYTGPRRLGETRGAIGPARLSAVAQDEKLGEQLWLVSEELTGFRYPWP